MAKLREVSRRGFMATTAAALAAPSIGRAQAMQTLDGRFVFFTPFMP